MSNIKELRLEFQRKGDLHIDNIRIVEHTMTFKRQRKHLSKFLTHGLSNLELVKNIGGVLTLNIPVIYNLENLLKMKAY